MGSVENFTMRNFVIFTVQISRIEVIKSIKLRWVRHVARMEQVKNAFKILA